MICHCCKFEISKEDHDRLAHCHRCFEITQVDSKFLKVYLKHSTLQNRLYELNVQFKLTAKRFKQLLEKRKK